MARDHVPRQAHHVAPRRLQTISDADRLLAHRRNEHADKVARYGLHTIGDLQPFAHIDRHPQGHLTIAADAGAIEQVLRPGHTARRFLSEAIGSFLRALDPMDVQLMADGPRPVARGEWVTWTVAPDTVTVAQAIESQADLDSPFHVRIFNLDRMHRLTSSGTYVQYRPNADHPAVCRAVVWKEQEADTRHRADGLDPDSLRQTILPRRPPKQLQYRFGGTVVGGAVDPSRWQLLSFRTLREPTPTPLLRVRNHHLYATLVAKRFQTDLAFPRAFRVGGTWHGLLTHGREEEETHDVFSLARTQLLPLHATQSLHHWHHDSNAVLAHMPGGGPCPICQATGHAAPNTSRHRLTGCAFCGLLI